MLLNLDETHPGARELLSSNGFSVSRSKVPCNRNTVDITIEQTINRHAKSCCGIIGFSWSHSAHYRWCKTSHYQASYFQTMREIIGMAGDQDPVPATHKELRSSQILKSEQNVANVIDAMTNFINPFTTEDPYTLYCIASGTPVPKEVEQDLLHADVRAKRRTLLL